MIIWLTGQPASGKTTLAKRLNGLLQHHKSMIIDGDDIRDIFKNKNYSKEGRYENIRNAQNIAMFLDAKCITPIVSLVSPYRELREELKNKTTVVEIYCHCDEIRGREEFFVKDYEKPLENFLDLDTGKETEDECIEKILAFYRTVATISQRP
jgi:adenylylsulfate kinase